MSNDTISLKQKVDQIKWWHQIDLGNGIVTPGIDNTPEKLKLVKLPERLDGKTVIDIGAWDGFFSFEAEKRGAKKVVAIDSFCWNGPGWGTKAGFDLVHEVLQSNVEAREMEVLDLSPEVLGTFDVTLFLGVLYHLRHPLLALENVSSVTKDFLILETLIDATFCKRPATIFYPEAEKDNDASNWWGPNIPMVTAMLKDVGFNKVEVVGKTDAFFSKTSSPIYRMIRAVSQKIKHNKPMLQTYQCNRAVFHAYK